MRILILMISIMLTSLIASDKYLGTFTIDNYPVKNCEVIKVGSLYSIDTSGISFQPQKASKTSLLKNLSDFESRSLLEKKAIKNGFNAILGYKYYVNGAFDTYTGSVKNGNIGLGLYVVTGQGTPVKIDCRK